MYAAKKSPHTTHDQPVSTGRVITLGIGTRKRERRLMTALSAVSLVLAAVVIVEGWMFHTGTLIWTPQTTNVLLPVTPLVSHVSKIPVPAPLATGPSPLPPAVAQKPSTQTVVATMAPLPATGKYDDIVLPATKPTLTTAPALPPAAPVVASKPSTAQAPIAPHAARTAVTVQRQNSTVTVRPVASIPAPANSATVNPSAVALAGTAAPAIPALALPVSAPLNSALDSAHKSLTQGDYATALMAYDRILDHDPRNIEALKGKAYVLQQTQQYEAAADIDGQLIKLDPNDHDNPVAAQGQSYMPSSMGELQKTVDADPSNAPAQAALANLLARRGYFDQAFVHLNHAAELVPNNLLYRLDLAILYDRAGHKPEALTLYQQVLNANIDKDQAARLPMSMDAIRARTTYLQQ